MAIRDIVIFPAPILNKRAEDVTAVDEEIRILINDMFETMYSAPGVGLAAPQVGISKRVIVLDPKWSIEGEERMPIALVNPVILLKDGKIEWEEGCLSLPNFREKIKRFSKVVVKGMNERGEDVRVEGEGLLSVILQHEIDHLDGILLLDRVSRLKRKLYIQWLDKRQNRSIR